MNQHLTQLVELSQIDKSIDAFDPRMAAVNAKVTAVSAEREKVQAITTQLLADIEDAEVKKRKNELHLAELQDKLKDNARKGAEIKNEREMKSLQLEEEIAKEQMTFANEEIERLDKIIDNRKAEIESDKQKLTQLTESEKVLQNEVATQLAEIEKERQKVFTQKQELVSKINQKGLAFYEKIRRWAKNTTAVEVKNQACYGCFLKISDKVYAEVIKGEDIVTCPHCGRILYIDRTEGETPAA